MIVSSPLTPCRMRSAQSLFCTETESTAQRVVIAVFHSTGIYGFETHFQRAAMAVSMGIPY